MTLRDRLARDGYVILPPDNRVSRWAVAAKEAAKSVLADPTEQARWLRHGKTWFVGVDALPNDASVGFHRSLGFEPLGVFPRVGRKFDTWYDVAWFYLPLAE